MRTFKYKKAKYMAIYQLNSPVVLFYHSEYGQRLLFQKGVSNPRDILGKNGVTIHNGFGSLFYKTISIRAMVADESGTQQSHIFNVNRNSLIKYLGKKAKNSDSDVELMDKLNAQLWSADNNKDDAQKQIQVDAGSHGLRHAGRHNQLPVNRNSFIDYLKGSFLGWLYQKTIGSLSLIWARFIFVRTEKDLLEAGEVLAKKRFHEAYQEVPAYKTHVVRFNGQPTDKSLFHDIPKTDKDNYIKYQQYDSETHFHGKYPTISKTDTSTGTTGKPTQWVRGEAELETVKKSLQLAAKIQFGSRPITYINAFALGPWATGLTTYELMRETGSVFATGPDKEKIFSKLISMVKYEKHQMELTVDSFLTKNPRLEPVIKKHILSIIDSTLKAILKNHDATLEALLNAVISTVDPEIQFVLRRYRSEIQEMVVKLNKEKTQIVIAGYPPFLKDLTAYAKEHGHDFDEFSAIGIVGGQAISEAMRDQLIKHGFNQIYSSYGASDLDINLGVESDYEITVRKAIEKNPGLARELYGENKGLPMIFHYDPMNYHVECDDDDNLLFTCARSDRSSPRIRYDLGDKGRVYATSDVQALLAKYGIFQKPRGNLPLMFVWGRDSTVVFHGANLAFTELERAVTTDEALEGSVLKKAFYTFEDEQGVEHLEIWLELNDNIELPKESAMPEIARNLLSNLASLNQDFRFQLERLDDGIKLPMVRFFKRNQSPISEAGGHRKQVLIFQKDVNLPKNYQLPNEENCRGISISKTGNLFDGEKLERSLTI